MLVLPHPFVVIPNDGSPPVYISETDAELGLPLMGVAYVTPYCAAKWLNSGDPIFHPVVMIDSDHRILAGRSTVEMAAAGQPDNPSAPTAAAMVEVNVDMAETAWTAVEAMRQVYEQTASDDIEGLVLSDTGRVLGGAGAIYDLHRPTVMIVLVVDPHNDVRFN